jgi:DNA polymerase-4
VARHFVDHYRPGDDVRHEVHGPGWVWGSGLGRVTVRFETATTGPGPIHTFALDDPQLRPAPVMVGEDEATEDEVPAGPGWLED